MSGVVGNVVKTYKIAAKGTAQAAEATDITSVGLVKLITAGADVHVKFGEGDATTSDYKLQANIDLSFPVHENRVSIITEGSSSDVFVAFIY
jgi:hypothetical protein